MVAALTLIFLGAMAAPSFAHYMASSTLAVNSAVSGGDAEQQRGLKLSPQRIPSGSLSVLRKYLPSVIAIHKAENLSEEEAMIPVKSTFDISSPFIDPQMRFKLVRVIGEWLGTRYKYGGHSKRGVDCSAFTSAVMSETLDMKYVGTSRYQAAKFTPIHDTDSLQFGDMLFFTGRNRRSSRIGHVGIYLGNGVFAHSSTNHGVIYTHLSDGYYTERFRWGGRFAVKNDQPVREISRYRYVQ